MEKVNLNVPPASVTGKLLLFWVVFVVPTGSARQSSPFRIRQFQGISAICSHIDSSWHALYLEVTCADTIP